MDTIKVSESINAPVGAVWEAITDIPGSVDRISAITAIERLDDGDGFDIGFKWKETRRIFGTSASETMEITAIDPGHSYTAEAASKGAHYTSVLSVEPRGDGSVLTMTFSGESTNLIAGVLAGTVGKLMAGQTRKAVQQDLRDIKAAVES